MAAKDFSGCNQGARCVRFGGSSLHQISRCAAAESWIPEMRISASKSEAMVLSCEKVACHFPVNDVLLSQIEKHKYLQFLLKVGQTGLLASCLQ